MTRVARTGGAVAAGGRLQDAEENGPSDQDETGRDGKRFPSFVPVIVTNSSSLYVVH